MAAPSAQYRVDRNTLRTNQACIVAFTLLAFILGGPYGRALVVFTAAVMGLGTVHPAFALFKQLHTRVLRPRGILGSDVHAEDPMPHQFAQALGAFFLVLSAIALFSGAPRVGWALDWIVAVLAFVNLSVQFCVGCFVYFQLDRVGLLPRAIAGNRAN